MPAYRDPLERFMEKVEKTDTCWFWTAYRNPRGYGRMRSGRRSAMILAHRFAYETHVGPVPDGMFLDHVCRVRHCVNPEHLRLATKKQNAENRARQANNTSGYQGVSLKKSSGRWQAYVCHEYRQISLGYFDTVEEAAEVARLKRVELFSHNDGDRT